MGVLTDESDAAWERYEDEWLEVHDWPPDGTWETHGPSNEDACDDVF